MLVIPPLDSPTMLAALGAGATLMLFLILLALWRTGRERSREATAQIERQAETEARVAELLQTQQELNGRLSAVGELLAGRQSELARAVAERLDAVSQRVGDGITAGARATAEQLQKLEGRIAVLDNAREQIGSLAEQVGGLKAILGNKQARGAFGQGRMEAIIRDALPSGAYSFQYTLASGSRPDCALHLPGDSRVLAIDAKFPLESFEELRHAETAETQSRAGARLRQDVAKHIKDIAEKYVIAGETQDIALLFIPSESLYADLQERFEDVVQRAHRARVLMVSPSLLMLAVQIVQGLVRDQAMREQARSIQAEVGHLLDDARRLAERVAKLKAHLGQTAGDLDAIEISTGRIAKRGTRIEQLEFDHPSGLDSLPNPIAPMPSAAE